MQIGKRWGVGESAPRSLPSSVLAAVREEERVLDELGADTASWGWTLTYLEGAPVVTLDDGTIITVIDGDVQIAHDD